MRYTTLVPVAVVRQQLGNPDWVVVDCRFSLADADAGGRAYRRGHLPGARYAHLERDLSAAANSRTGRHPLPDWRLLARKLGAWGIGGHSQVVAYDDAGGVYAARFWWLLRCLGHGPVAVLDGGAQAWRRAGGALTTVLPAPVPRRYPPRLDTRRCLGARQLEAALARKSVCLLDARSPERFRGEQEPIDPVAGHIPGALNRPYQANLAADGLFLAADALRGQFLALLAGRSPEQVVHQCGSGVTACHNLLAMEHAGLAGAKLYAGSWSEWIRDPNRAVATG